RTIPADQVEEAAAGQVAVGRCIHQDVIARPIVEEGGVAGPAEDVDGRHAADVRLVAGAAQFARTGSHGHRFAAAGPKEIDGIGAAAAVDADRRDRGGRYRVDVAVSHNLVRGASAE